MAVTFPTSPSNGDTFTANGLSYVYNSTYGVWRLDISSGSGGAGGVTVYATLAELPLSGVDNGSQAFVSENDRLYLWADTGWFNIALTNTAPTITQGGAGTYVLATNGTPTVITLLGNDPEGIPLNWSYTVTGGSLTNGGGATATVSQADNVFTITPTTTEAYAGFFQLRFAATDGVNVADDYNNFTLNFVTTIQDSKSTTALLSAISTSGTFIDDSSSNNTINAVGDPYLTSLSPYRSGGYSAYFDGGGDYFEMTNGGGSLGSGDWTVEYWVYHDSLGANQIHCAYGNYEPAFYYRHTNQRFAFYHGGATVVTSVIPETNKWYHLAFVHDTALNNLKIFIDGNLEETIASYATNVTSSTLRIGDDGTSSWMHGYIRDLRVTRAKVYEQNFTPPDEPLTATSDTEVLTCHLPYIKDGRLTASATITAYGDAHVKPFGPYDYDTYDRTIHGGSVYFDGTSADSIWVGNNTIMSSMSDWTIDFWYYPLSLTHNSPQYTVLYHSSNAGLYGAGTTEINLTSDGTIKFFVDAEVMSSGTSKVQTKQWNHIAVTQNSTYQRMYLNGKEVDNASGSTVDINQNKVPYIGDRMASAQSANYPSYGYISDFRLHQHSLYSTDFDPPTEVTPSTSEPVSSQTTRFQLTFSNAKIIDKSQMNRLRLLGDVTNSAETKYASRSIDFDGTGDYITFNLVDPIGTSDYTIEGWVNFSSLGANRTIVTVGGTQQFFYRNNGSSMGVYGISGPTTNFTTGTVNINTWYHFAYVRSGTTLTLYWDGSSTGTVANTDDMSDAITIGTWNGSADNMDGYIEDLRITNGLARYTSNFTPPTSSLDG